MDDRELAAACAAGNESAWIELIRRHDRKVRHVLWRSGAREELDDLRQEVWARLLSRQAASLRAFRAEHPGALQLFIGLVAQSVAIDHGRARRPSAEVSDELPDPAAGPESVARLRRLVATLDRVAAEAGHPARDRDILRLHFEEGYTPTEIAGMGLGLGVRGVEAVLRRARERLRELLEEP